MKSLIVLIIALVASPLHAQVCRTGQCNTHVQAVQHVQLQQVAYPPVYYAVGQHLQDRALIRQELRLILREELQGLIQAAPVEPPTETVPQEPEPPIEEEVPPVFSQRNSVIQSSCIRCHSGEKPKGDFSLDGPLTDAKRVKSSRAVLNGEMPPNKPLSIEAKSDFIWETLAEE